MESMVPEKRYAGVVAPFTWMTWGGMLKSAGRVRSMS
jgi:hypothetical protein